ncbi:MAG: 30S ribosomal protein S15 [Candidatus Paceibacterota bacterium]
MAISKKKKGTVIKRHQKHDKDTGSAEVQIGLLTDRITELAKHLKDHQKDHHSRRGLLMMVGKRRRLLRFLSSENEDEYKKLAKKLGISSS